MSANKESHMSRVVPAGRGRLLRLLSTLAALALLAACASAPTSGPEGSARAVPASEEAGGTALPLADTADEAREQAAEALSAGNRDLALYMFLQAVELDPEDADSMYAVGVIHREQGNAEVARRAFARAVEMDPGHPAALQALGVAHFQARDLEAATEMLERAVAADSSLWRAHNVLGVIADTRGEHAAAVRHYDIALHLRPRDAAVLNNRGYSYYLAGELDAAEDDLLLATAADTGYERAWHNLGLVYASQRRYGFALRALSNVMSRHVAANDIGYIAMQDGDYEAAATLFEEALRLSPRHYETAVENMAELRRRSNGGEPLLTVER